MSNDVTQWLAEIRSLQDQLVEAHRDRDAAYESAANWRRLYETEAQQRRIDARLAEEALQALRQQMQSPEPTPDLSGDVVPITLKVEVERLQTVPELQSRLLQTLMERDRLSQDLKTEQAEHAQTRKSLTMALGDAIDTLARERAAWEAQQSATTPAPDPSSTPSH